MPPTKCSRWSAITCLTCASLACSGGVGGYVVMTYQFGTWLSGVYLANDEVTYSFVTPVAATICALTFLCPILLGFCGQMPCGRDPADEYDERMAAGEFGPPPDYGSF